MSYKLPNRYMFIYDNMCATGKNATKTHKSMKVIILSLLNSVYTEEFDENAKVLLFMKIYLQSYLMTSKELKSFSI